MKKLSILLVLLMLFIAACGSQQSVTDGEIPTIPATDTAVPHVTTTPPAVVDVPELAPVDWTALAAHEDAMRPDYVSDLQDWADGNRYYIEATLDMGETAAIITGAQRTRFRNMTGDTLDNVVFRLYPNLTALAGRMRVSNATVDGESVEAEYLVMESALSVPLPEPLPDGEVVEITLDFVVVAERGMNASYGRFGYQLDLLAAPGWHPMLSVYEDGEWWTERASPQGDPDYSETALYEIFLTHQEGIVIAASGVVRDEVNNGDGTVTKHMVTGPMRASIIIASPIIGVVSDVVDDVTVNIFYLPGGERGAEWALEVSLDSVRIFNEYFGDYPFAEMDIVETFTRAGGVEFPGLVVINDLLWNPGSSIVESVIAHEVAHQWWYSLVGNDQVNHPWIDESLTSYSENYYWRYAYDDDGQRAFDDIAGARNGYNFFRGSAGSVDLPMNLPVTSYANNQYGPLIYTKGVVFYSELEERIGTEAFTRALQSYFAEKRYQIATSYDILRHMEEASGQDLDAFFYEWLGDFEGLDPEVKAEVDAANERDS